MKPGTPGFVGARLRAAREARGISSAAGLAEMIGVSRAAVSQYENGTQTPSPAAMRSISDVLNLPIQHFLRPIEQSDGTRFFRSMASATKAARARAAGKHLWLRDIIHTLKGYVRFPRVDFPQVDFPKDVLKISDDMIEDAATVTRRHWGLGDGPISNVAWLLENNGSVVVRLDLDSDKLDAFSAWPEGGREPHIILGTNKGTAARSRFNAGHELAHMILHRHIDQKQFATPSTFREMERQAHRFSGAFLLPRDTFLDDLYDKSLDAMCELKPKWKVAVALMVMRADDLGALSDGHSKSLWINLARRGWKRREPYDDSLPVEEPVFLRRCVAMLIEKNLLHPLELSSRFGLTAADVEELTNAARPLAPRVASESKIQEVAPAIIKFPRAATS